MNNDLISRSEVKKLGATCLARRNENGQLEAIISLDNAPTVEYPFYQEAYQTGYEEGKNDRPHGKPLIRTNGDMSNYYICSECHYSIDGWDKFCKNCGADLRGKG